MLRRVLGLLLLVHAASAANWPTWRGENGLGVAQEAKLPLKWSATENVLWNVPLPERGNSTPVVWKDKVFLTQAIDERRTVMCLDRQSGKTLWQSGTSYNEKEETHETNPYCSASPVTDGERIIVSYASDGLFCYEYQMVNIGHIGQIMQEMGWVPNADLNPPPEHPNRDASLPAAWAHLEPGPAPS